MARKIFNQPTTDEAPSPSLPKRGSVSASVGGLRESLREITANSIRDLDPSQIEQDGLRDRLATDEDGIEALAQSIRTHGQQVPILVRPSDAPDRYRIIYGRRRLAAIRRIGGTVKAIVRTLDNEAAVIAQGQENNIRLDPSFIEKALFIREMSSAGYKPQVIQDALGLSRQGVSNHKVVLDRLEDDVIALIGPAHGVGRRQWTDLADAAPKDALVQIARQAIDALPKDTPNTERFQAVLDAARQKAQPEPPAPPASARSIQAPDGTPIADLRRTKSAVTLQVSLGKAPGFGQWMSENAERLCHELHARWQSEADPDKNGSN